MCLLQVSGNGDMADAQGVADTPEDPALAAALQGKVDLVVPELARAAGELSLGPGPVYSGHGPAPDGLQFPLGCPGREAGQDVRKECLGGVRVRVQILGLETWPETGFSRVVSYT